MSIKERYLLAFAVIIAVVALAMMILILTANGWLRFGWGPEHKEPVRTPYRESGVT